MKTKLLLGVAAAGVLVLLSSRLTVSAATLHFMADAGEARSVDFVVKLPLRNSAELDRLIALQARPESPEYHHFLTRAQFRASFGPTRATFARAEETLRENGFSIASVDSQMLHVRGTSGAIARAFHCRLGLAREANHPLRYAARTPIVLPQALRALGATVVNLSPTIRAKPFFKRAVPENRYSELGQYWFDDLKQAYSYPSYKTANGKGITIATVGEADYSSSDALAYFRHEKLGSPAFPAPTLGRVLLPGADPYDPANSASDEADLDIQQAGGSAPGATIVGVAVDGPSEPFLTAYSYLDDTNFADIVSTSYGQCELYYTAAYNDGIDYTNELFAYHDLFRQGNSQGITFVFASGDYSGVACFPAAYFGPATGKTYFPLAHGAGTWVDDPNVTGVGGTNLLTTYTTGNLGMPGPRESKYVSENAIGDRITTAVDWDGTGNAIADWLWGSSGGPSAIFSKPAFQELLPTGYGTRTVPDVAMHMGGCPNYGPGIDVVCEPANRDSGDLAIIDGQLAEAIGSSASSPEFAGLLAVKESIIGSRLGNANEDIYRLAAANAAGHYFHQGIYAYNGVVHVARGQLGYNPIVGVGTPIANNFVGLPEAPLAGEPQTPSNP